MSRAGGPGPSLRPERCDGCGRCERVCSAGALRADTGYLFLDRASCDACGLCVAACDKGAIVMPVAARPPRRAAAAPSAPVERPPAPESPMAPPSAPRGWTLPEAVAVLAAFLALFVAEEAVLSSSAVRALSPGAASVTRLLVLGAYYAAQLGLLALLARRRGAGLARAFGLVGGGGGPGRRLGSVTVTAGTLAVTLAAMVAWGVFTSRVGWEPPDRWSTDLTALFGSGFAGLVITLALAALLAPFTEELVFRGVLLGAARDRWGATAATWVSAGAFALFHFSVWQLVPALILGWALAWLALRRGSLWPAILLHAAYNAVAVLAAFWLSRIGSP